MSVSKELMTALTRVTAAFVVLGALGLTACVAVLAPLGPFTARFAAGAYIMYGGVAAVVLIRINAFHPYPGFGAANAATLARLVLTSLFAGLALDTGLSSVELAPATAWLFVVIALVSLALDGIDGFLARRLGQTSPFGSRFDMEVDALQILMLSILAYTLGKAGAWVLMGGLLRYIYVAAGWVWPALNRRLPPSTRRKVVCVIQSGALAGLLAPIVVPPVSTGIAFAALGLLIISFGQDVIWNLRATHHGSE